MFIKIHCIEYIFKFIGRFNSPNFLKGSNGGENNVEAQLSPESVHPYIKPTADISHIVIDCSPMSYLDAPGISTLAQVRQR